MGLIRLKTCISCGEDNPYNAGKCNKCAEELHAGGFFSFNTCNFHRRWVCPECNRVNMEENGKCVCGYRAKGFLFSVLSSILKFLFWLIVFVFVIAIFGKK
jgi:hypothetical protein